MGHIKSHKQFSKGQYLDFIIEKDNYIFQLFTNDILVAESYYSTNEPDDLFNQKYVGLFKLKTIEVFQGKGYMKYLLDQIFNYVKNELGISSILLNVYKDNQSALNLYINSGFGVYKDYEQEDEEEPYFTLIKKL